LETLTGLFLIGSNDSLIQDKFLDFSFREEVDDHSMEIDYFLIESLKTDVAIINQ
jgi:hypothetical protein